MIRSTEIETIPLTLTCSRRLELLLAQHKELVRFSLTESKERFCLYQTLTFGRAYDGVKLTLLLQHFNKCSSFFRRLRWRWIKWINCSAFSIVMLSIKRKEFCARNIYLRSGVSCQIEGLLLNVVKCCLCRVSWRNARKSGVRSWQRRHLVDACGYALSVGFLIPPRTSPINDVSLPSSDGHLERALGRL
jgi:hypothetical protein